MFAPLIEKYSAAVDTFLKTVKPYAASLGRAKNVVVEFKYLEDARNKFNPVREQEISSIEQVAAVYDVIGDIETAMDKIYRAAADLAREDKSFRETAEIIRNECSEYKKFSLDLDNDFFQDAIKNKKPEVINEIADKLRLNKFHLFLVREFFTSAGKKAPLISERIEEIKNRLLHSERSDLMDEKFDPSIGLISRYGLIPVTEFMPLNRLFELISRPYDTTVHQEDNIRALNVGLIGSIIIKRLTGNPIELNIRPLIDAEYVNSRGLLSQPGAGLNEKIIERFNTARNINRLNTIKPPYTFQKNISMAAQKVYIFETLNNREFRLLAHDFYTRDYLVDRALIRGIEKGLSTRARQYNAAQLDSDFMDPAATYIISTVKELKSTISIDSIVARISTELISILETSPIGDDVATKLKQIIRDHAAAVVEKVLGEIFSLPKYFEARMTAVSKIDDIISLFTELASRHISKKRLPAGANAIEMKRAAADVFREAISSALREIDKRHLISELDFSTKELFMKQKDINFN